MKSTVDATRMRVVYARVLALFQQAASQPARITPYIYDVMLSFDGTADTSIFARDQGPHARKFRIFKILLNCTLSQNYELWYARSQT